LRNVQLKSLLPYYQKLKKLVFPIFLLISISIFYALLTFAHPWIYKIVFDNLIPTYDKDLLIQIIVCLFSIGILNIISNTLIDTLTVYIKMETISLIRIEITQNLLRYRYSYFQRTQSGEIIERIIPEVDEIGEMIAGSVKVASYFIQIVLLLFLIAIINVSMFMISVIVLTMYSVWFRLCKKPLATYDRRIKKHNGELYSIIEELLENVKNIKLFNLHEIKVNDVRTKLNAIEVDAIKNGFIKAVFEIGNRIYPIANLIITAFCFHAILNEKMTIGYYLVFTAMVENLIGPINVLLGFGEHFQSGVVSAKRIEEIITQDAEKSGNRKLTTFSSEISLENISFRYSDVPVLNKISLKVKKGQSVAIVGGSGSGKTTIAHLLVRLHDPTQGRIVIDGIPLLAFELIDVRNKIGLLSQDIFLFNDTVKENLNPDGSMDGNAMELTLSKAQMPGFVHKLGFIIGEQGQKLSGGERQRLSIARLLGRKCEIMILDEATSSLDPRTTKELLKTFEDIRRDNPQMTFITITHDADNLHAMDNIFLLENGSITAQGTYAELAAHNQCFRKLFNETEAGNKQTYERKNEQSTTTAKDRGLEDRP
jgi:ABC-type bacteriocin/lantibiotic exporter with double-glycine peptidase domain